MTKINNVLLILDGFGYREAAEGNAIKAAKAPNLEKLWASYPHTLLEASGLAVGLPDGQMGNSEVGHLHIGAGRLVRQELTRIDAAIENGSFDQNAAFNEMIDKAKAAGTRVHVMGLASDGGVHSHLNHLLAMLELLAKRGVPKVSLHLFLDGRDTLPQSAEKYLKIVLERCQKLKLGEVESLSGRFYAMDRDKRYDRVAKAYEMLVNGTANQFAGPIAALQHSYQQQVLDEFVEPVITTNNFHPIADGDWVVFMNFRADRARELSYALTKTDDEIEGFTRSKKVHLAGLVTLTNYASDLKANVAFNKESLVNTLGEAVSKQHLAQLRLAETEKYAHVTYFMNGGIEKPWPQEERILVPSPKVATYDLKPEMSAGSVTENLIKALNSKKYALIIVNFANPDMVGHTGKFKETVAAIEFIDQCLGRILEVIDQTGGQLLLTADHGNAEMMVDPSTAKPYTAHTVSLVPAIYYGPCRCKVVASTAPLSLKDVAPTMLYLMGLEVPKEMTGKSFLQKD